MHRGEWGMWERNHMQWNEISSSQLEPQSLGVLKSEALAPSLIQVWEEPVIKETVTKLLSLPTQPWSSLWKLEICGTLPVFMPVPFHYMIPDCLHMSFTVAWVLAGFLGAQIPQLPELWWLLNSLGADKLKEVCTPPWTVLPLWWLSATEMSPKVDR